MPTAERMRRSAAAVYRSSDSLTTRRDAWRLRLQCRERYCFDTQLQRKLDGKRISGARMSMYGTVTEGEVTGTAVLISEMNETLRDGLFIIMNLTTYSTCSSTQTVE